MKILSPSTMRRGQTDSQPRWFRLARTDDGLLCLESISDASLNSDPLAEWAFYGDAPPRIAKQLADDDDPDQVAKVLNIAVHAMAYA